MNLLSPILFLLAQYSTITEVASFAPFLRPAFRATSSIRTGPPLSKPTILRSSTLERTETSTEKAVETDESELTRTPPNSEQAAQNAAMRQFDRAYSSDIVPRQQEVYRYRDDNNKSKIVELAGVGTLIAGLSSFLIINNYVGPWPEDLIQSIPVQYYGLAHAVGGMLFGGGIILTTLIEWLATASKNAPVLNFWFGKVPALDSFVVLPALTASIVSGVGLSIDHYGSLSQAPFHVVSAISTLLAFAVWWASTDLTTQGAAKEAVDEWVGGDPENTDVPQILDFRKISNVVSCAFVVAIYAIMVLKPGFAP